jgi:hypothetical protein
VTTDCPEAVARHMREIAATIGGLSGLAGASETVTVRIGETRCAHICGTGELASLLAAAAELIDRAPTAGPGDPSPEPRQGDLEAIQGIGGFGALPKDHARLSPGPFNCEVRYWFQTRNRRYLPHLHGLCERCGRGPCLFFDGDGNSLFRGK